MNGDVSKGSAIGTTSTAAALVVLAQPILAAHGYAMNDAQLAAAVALLTAIGHGPFAALVGALMSKLTAPKADAVPAPQAPAAQ